jgi:hypothetical protein
VEVDEGVGSAVRGSRGHPVDGSGAASPSGWQITNPTTCVSSELLFAGFGILAKFSKIGEQHLVRRTLLATIAGPALIAFFFDVAIFDFWFYLVAIPIIVFLSILLTVAKAQLGGEPVARILNGALIAVGLVMITMTATRILASFSSLDGHHLLLLFYLPIWLTLGAWPYVYAIGLYARREQAELKAGSRVPNDASDRLGPRPIPAGE